MPQNGQGMLGKVCLVTGATSGIGEVTARELARNGATVILWCRSQSKGDEVRESIRKDTGSERAHVVVADLASFADIRRGAAEVLAKWDRLDVLLNNAGAINMDRTLTQDGLETTFAVNHLAPFLLTHLLLDRLKQSAPSRVITVSSSAHYRQSLDLADLEGKRAYDGWSAYGRSKLCNVLFTKELAKRLAGTNVTANCLHPGVVATGFGRNRPGWFKLGIQLISPFTWTPEKGATASLHLARSPEVANVSGEFFYSNAKIRKPSRPARDPELARGLWEISERLTGVAS